MDGLPGVIASDDDFGINSAGIMITETTITGFTLFDPAGKPEFYRARKAMQYSNSIDDYVRIMLDGNNGGYANDWLLGDNKTGEIALFELGLKEHSVRRTNDGYYVGSNFPVDQKLATIETNFDFSNRGGSPLARKARWETLVEKSKNEITVETVKQMEGDTYDAFENKQGPNERSLCGCVERSARGIPEWDWGKFFPGGTVQAKAVDSQMASRMQIWAAMGHPCGFGFVAATFIKEASRIRMDQGHYARHAIAALDHLQQRNETLDKKTARRTQRRAANHRRYRALSSVTIRRAATCDTVRITSITRMVSADLRLLIAAAIAAISEIQSS